MATSLPPVSPLPALSQGERVLDTYIAPSKTFTDVRRSASWWLPFVIGVVVSYLLMIAVQTKVGWPQVVENALHASPAQTEKMEQSPPEQQQKVRNVMQMSYRIGFLASPVIALVFGAIVTGLFMMTVNFVLGAEGKFGQYFAVWIYSGLALAVQSLLTVVLLFAGGGGENFRLDNPIGTNPGFYFAPGAIAPWLSALLSSLDLFTLWVLVLMSIGYSVVGRISRSAAATVVFGWWGMWVIIKVAMAAIRG
jgi:hypothetical protein